MNLEQLYQELWNLYCRWTPQAMRIHSELEKRNEKIINDHVAYRTWRCSQVGIEKFDKLLSNLGYQSRGEYFFKEKKLYARHYENIDQTQPKVFVSELIVEQLSLSAQRIIQDLIQQIPEDAANHIGLLTLGRTWQIRYSHYQELFRESEYAAWLSAFGFMPNHFTVSFNHLKSFPSLNDLNQFILQLGFLLNTSGGEIKGSPDLLLEQSSTLAEKQFVPFVEGDFQVPTCYYEFARRYPDQGGRLFQGFLEGSADRIFESTNG